MLWKPSRPTERTAATTAAASSDSIAIVRLAIAVDVTSDTSEVQPPTL